MAVAAVAVAANVIDGEAIAAELRDRVEAEMGSLREAGIRPGLATVLAGDDYAAQAYERRLRSPRPAPSVSSSG